jgi:hypothetical protein
VMDYIYDSDHVRLNGASDGYIVIYSSTIHCLVCGEAGINILCCQSCKNIAYIITYST